MAALVTISEWAKQQGISRQAAYKRARRMSMVGGKIDPAEYGQVGDAKQQMRGAHSRGRFGPKVQAVTTAPKPPGANGTPRALASRGPTLPDLQHAREAVRLQKEELLLRRLRGSLVDAEETKANVEARFREDSEALLNFPARVAGEMAAELGNEERLVFASLDKHIRQFMRERSGLTMEAN